MAHINKIKFYCHQLNMCAKVKAEVQNIAGELVVSGLDSATSLIQVLFSCNASRMTPLLGCEEPDECCCSNRQGFICCFHEIQAR